MDATANQEDFWVTLPSNSNLETDPTNRCDDYVVRLRKPLLVGSGDDDRTGWEAALLSIQYSPDFRNFETANIYVVLEHAAQARQSQAQAAVTEEVPAVGLLPFMYSAVAVQQAVQARAAQLTTDSARTVSTAPIESDRAVDRYVKKLIELCDGNKMDGYDKARTVVGKATIVGGYFQSSNELGTYVCKQLTELTKPKYNSQWTFLAGNPNADSTHPWNNISLEGGKAKLFVDDVKLATALGMSTVAATGQLEGLHLMSKHATFHPKPDLIHSLYVYTNVTQYQAVGNIEAPLLGIVPVERVGSGVRSHWAFSPPCYLGVSKSYIDSIHVKIRTDRGERIHFGPGTNVVCCIRFRKKRI